MFELVVSNAKSFKASIDAIVTLIDEGEFQLTENGLVLKAMDPSQIAMVSFVMPKSAFEKYEVEGDQKIGLNLEDLAKVMSRVRGDEKLVIKLDESKARLVLLFKGKTTRRFVVPLLDISASAPREPSIDFESKIKFSGNFFKEALKDTGLVSSHVVLSSLKDAFVIEANGDKGEVSIRADKGSDQLFDYTVKSESRAMYPLDYLNDLLKNTDAATAVDLELRTDAPLRLAYKIDDATITYYLAPRIETA
ncbi:MAG: proliferating cell nuclear antigen (pcna) [Candidatus Diapherotrites archaeon]|nr:proliferating cell nuclear antigen (pcna) [Candidatus Diapherotrites archaeon]